MSIPLGPNYVGILLYTTPTASDDNAGNAIASQQVRITRATPAPTDPDLEVDTFKADADAVAALKAIASPSSGVPFNRVDYSKRGPQELIATLSYSNSNLFGLGTIIPGTGGGQTEGNFSASTTIRDFDLLVIEENKSIGFGSSTPVTTPRVVAYPLPEPVTIWTVRAEKSTYNTTDLDIITQQTGMIHQINGRLYKFLGARSVQRSGTEQNPRFVYTYEWEIDPGTLARNVEDLNALDGDQLGEPTVFEDPEIRFTNPSSTTTYFGDWWRPPYCKLIAVQRTTLDPVQGSPVGILSTNPEITYFVNGRTDAPNSWLVLPGNPIGSL